MFKATAQDGLARCGVVISKQTPISTPAPMLYTRRGSSMFLTPDLLEKLRPEAQLVQINALQL
jgi:queuine/archaeosine tRNA-ribosyltransferase